MLYTSRLTLHALRLATPRWLTLAALGGASLAIYWIGLLLPYNLFALHLKPLLNIAILTSDKRGAQAGFVVTFAALSGLYYLAWRTCRGISLPTSPKPSEVNAPAWLALLASLLAVNVSMLWLYPIGAADIFDNILRGRITAEYGGNPFYEPPAQYAQDPFFPYAAWRASASAYGPLWETLAAGTSRLVGDDKLANVLGFKLLGLVFYFGCTALIASILNRHAPERALQGVCLFAWNPLVIYETAGNGHNDILMAFCILLGLWALLRGRFTWAALALTAGALVKFVPILLLPIALATGLRALPASRRAAFLLGTGLACAALVAAAYAPFWRGGDPLALGRRERLLTTSLPAVAQAQLERPLGARASQQVVSVAALLLTAIAVLSQTRRIWRESRTPLAEEGWLLPVQASAFILLFYLLLTCLWFQPWYTLWPLTLAAILPEGATARTAVLLSYAALWKATIFDFLLYGSGPLPPRVWRETWLGPATLGLAWLYVGYIAVRARGIRDSSIHERSPRRR